MLDIDTLISAKKAAGREHDLAAVMQPHGIKERTQRKQQP
jgi:hypothetical protein